MKSSKEKSQNDNEKDLSKRQLVDSHGKAGSIQ
jgi:hypothetical protein